VRSERAGSRYQRLKRADSLSLRPPLAGTPAQSRKSARGYILASAETIRKTVACRLIVVGGHTRSIGKTQLVCDIIAALPEAVWLAGKITQYGHGLCAQNGEECDCAPTEHVAALDWEEVTLPLTRGGADSARFLRAGAKRAFWLRTKQGYLAEGMPLLREALARIYREAEYADGDECGGSKLTLGGQRNVEQNCGDQSSGINPLLQNQGLNVIERAIR